jgi:hypothetical protein
LYGKKYCNVQQLLPSQTFGTLTVLHLPNKNYRRVGKYRNRTFATGNETFDLPHTTLLLSMELHIAVRKYMYKLLNNQQKQQKQHNWLFSSLSSTTTNNDNENINNNIVYTGAIRMIDEVTIENDRKPFLERRMKEYNNYIKRGGILSENDMIDFDLVDPDKVVTPGFMMKKNRNKQNIDVSFQ